MTRKSSHIYFIDVAVVFLEVAALRLELLLGLLGYDTFVGWTWRANVTALIVVVDLLLGFLWENSAF